MSTFDHLRQIELALGVNFPPSFLATYDEFVGLCCTPDFRHAFPIWKMLLSVTEIDAVREGIPDNILPFMREDQPEWPDIYGFDLDSQWPEYRVVIWSDHAIVMEWVGFAAFLKWIREQVSESQSD